MVTRDRSASHYSTGYKNGLECIVGSMDYISHKKKRNMDHTVTWYWTPSQSWRLCLGHEPLIKSWHASMQCMMEKLKKGGKWSEISHWTGVTKWREREREGGGEGDRERERIKKSRLRINRRRIKLTYKIFIHFFTWCVTMRRRCYSWPTGWLSLAVLYWDQNAQDVKKDWLS